MISFAEVRSRGSRIDVGDYSGMILLDDSPLSSFSSQHLYILSPIFFLSFLIFCMHDPKIHPKIVIFHRK